MIVRDETEAQAGPVGNGHRVRAVLALAIGIAVGVAYPLVDLAVSCRQPDSEACVWGKAYLLLTMSISVPLLGGVCAYLVYRLLTRLGSR